MRRRKRAALGILMAAMVTGTAVGPRPARAQSAADRTAAEALYDEGKRLLAEKRFAEACTRFESSQRLDPGVGTLLFLADCYETVGRTASAWSTFREAASAAKAAAQPDREAIARDRAARLGDKLFQLTISVSGATTPGLRVTRDETEVKKEVWGVGVPVDPGTFKLSATAPGKKAWSTTVEIPKEAGSRTVAVPALEDLPPEAKAVAPVPTAPPPATGWSSGRTAGFIAGGLGLVGVGVGAAFGGLAAGKFSDARARCPNPLCGDQEGVDLAQQAGAMADVSTALFVAGGAVLAGGVIVFLIAPGSPPGARTSWISPMIGNGAAGFRAGSTW